MDSLKALLPSLPAVVGVLGNSPKTPNPEPPWDAAVVYPGADWRSAAPCLGPGGKLLLAVPREEALDGIPARDALEIALAEAGFALRPPRRQSGEAEWLQAGATPFAVRETQEGDEAQILDLFERSFHHRRGAEHWRWQYRDNPCAVAGQRGPRITVATEVAAGEEERLVAHYAGYPVAFYRRGETLIAHQIGDTMTAPEVRSVGRGPTSLLARCGRHFYARYCRRQVAFNYGFNVGNIQKFSIRFLDAHRIEDVPFYRRAAATPLPPPAKSWTGKPLYRLQVDAVPNEGWDRLFHQVAPHYGALVRRTAEYLRWRYCDRPGFDYLLVAAHRRRTPVAWAVFRRDGDRLLWGDFLCHPRHPQAARDLLAAALEHPAHQGVERVEGWFPPRPEFLPKVLDWLGFERLPEPQDLALMCVSFEDPAAPEWLGRELYYTMGDGDLF
jgi:hypothetical protein